MTTTTFDYEAPLTLEDAVAALCRAPGAAKVLAGGQSLLPLLNARRCRVRTLVDIGRVPELAGIRPFPSFCEIGAGVTQRELEHSDAVAAGAPLLLEAVRHVGTVAIRNRGTVCGSLAHADPGGELGVAMLALDARMCVRGPSGDREIDAADFFRGPYVSDLGPDEILTSVRVPTVAALRAEFAEASLRTHDVAIISVAIALGTGRDGLIDRCRVVVGGAGPTPQRMVLAERLLEGRDPESGLTAAFEDAVASGLDPLGDARASASYRRRVAGVLARRSAQRLLALSVAGDG